MFDDGLAQLRSDFKQQVLQHKTQLDRELDAKLRRIRDDYDAVLTAERASAAAGQPL